MKNELFYWGPVIVYMLGIFYISSMSSSELPGSDGVDLSPLHIVEYFILSSLIYRAMESRKLVQMERILLSILFAVAYGITDEFHQIFVPGRTFDFIDMIFNLIGSSLIVYKIRGKK